MGEQHAQLSPRREESFESEVVDRELLVEVLRGWGGGGRGGLSVNS